MGLRVAIICNGAFPRKAFPRYLIQSADVIICCDGALKSYLRAAKNIFGTSSDGNADNLRLPDAIVGDLDSLSPSLKDKYKDRIICYEEQDHNDMTKAFRYVMEELGAQHNESIDEVHFLAATGLREDHTLGNISLLMEYTRMYDLGDMLIDMVSDYGTIFAVNDTCELHLGEGHRVSIISPDNSLRIKSSGLVWKTDDVVFDNLWKATLNKTCEDVVRLEFNHPSMAVIMTD